MRRGWSRVPLRLAPKGERMKTGMAERDEPGIAHEHVETKREDGVDQDLADDVDVVAVDDPQRHGDERQKRKSERDPPRHGACLPNRPCGRTSKMSSIGRKRMM